MLFEFIFRIVPGKVKRFEKTDFKANIVRICIRSRMYCAHC